MIKQEANVKKSIKNEETNTQSKNEKGDNSDVFKFMITEMAVSSIK